MWEVKGSDWGYLFRPIAEIVSIYGSTYRPSVRRALLCVLASAICHAWHLLAGLGTDKITIVVGLLINFICHLAAAENNLLQSTCTFIMEL